jgi:hypothetical protein
MHDRILFCAVLLGGATLAQAGTWVDMSIVDRDDHRPLETYHHRGKTYVAGRVGDYYAVRLTNHTRERLLMVLSVDGVNAITGQTASPDQSGYVLQPWATSEITGWRKGSDEVAGFYFTSLSDSYADRTDRPANVGVIGVAVFREERLPQPKIAATPHHHHEPRPLSPRGRDDLAHSDLLKRQEADLGSVRESGISGGRRAEPAAPAEQAEIMPRRKERIGTGHGEREYSRVDYTSFRRASARPAEVLSVFYDSYDNLVAQGVIGARRHGKVPEPFPGGFVPDPPR